MSKHINTYSSDPAKKMAVAQKTALESEQLFNDHVLAAVRRGLIPVGRRGVSSKSITAVKRIKALWPYVANRPNSCITNGTSTTAKGLASSRRVSLTARCPRCRPARYATAATSFWRQLS